MLEFDHLPGGYLNRTLCDVLQEMRVCNRVRNYSILTSLIEEAQIMGNRMESKLYERKNYYELCAILRKKLKTLGEKNADKE